MITINDKEDIMSKPDDGETAIEKNVITNKSIQNKDENKIKEKNQGINLNKNFNLEEDFQSFSEILDSQILGERNTKPLLKIQILEFQRRFPYLYDKFYSC